jgi:N-acetyl-anhydromuramyl-L-alanine amidase AmpD
MTGRSKTPLGLWRSRDRRKYLLLFLTASCLLAITAVQVRKARSVARINRAFLFIPSPNHDSRPLFTPVNCVVLHATAEPTLQGTIAIFKDRRSKVSAHFVVDRDGRIVQMVPVQDRAWHAGASQLDGRSGVNDFSIGIEMVNVDDGIQPYPEQQYRSVARIIRLLRTAYSIPNDRIVTHARIALPPGRKPDPRGFDMLKLKGML